MPTYLYRKSSGEVLGMSVDASAYSNVDPTYFGVATDPLLAPNGTDLVPQKLYDPLLDTLRNALQLEIDGFAAAEAADDNLAQRETAKVVANDLPDPLGKVIRATVVLTVDELNDLRQWIESFKAATAASTSLANFQSRVAALPNMPDITYTQSKTKIRNTIDGGTVD